MTVWNLGSINLDLIYSVPHLPGPGETLAATGFDSFLGGKGCNMSVAVARAGTHVAHIGAFGADGAWAKDRLTEYGVDTRFVQRIATPTGQAIIAVADDGENNIILYPGANREISTDQIGLALSEAKAGDWFVTQNETNGQAEAAKMARDLGLRVAYAAAPFEAASVEAVLEYLDFLILNEIEAQQLEEATGKALADLPVGDIVVTLGAKGARHIGPDRQVAEYPAYKVTPVDTTGAGDTFTGYVLAGLDRGHPMAQAIGTASKAGALMVTRHGTSDVIPDLKEVQDAEF